MAHKGKTPAIGIDLGTTYSCVGVWLNNRVEIIANDLGNRTTPSYIAFNDKERLIGEAAKFNALNKPSGTIFDAKRLIGRRFSDETVKNDVKNWPFQVIGDSDDKPMVVVEHKGEEKQFFPEQVSAMVLEKMCGVAEKYLGTKIKKAVVTVPAYFNDAQRQATKDAGKIAGLEVIRIINEPTAAAIAYGFQRDIGRKGPKNVLVFDLGGGTFDVSLVSINGSEYKVMATKGNTHLGGEDIDNRMMKYFVQEFKKQHNEDIEGNLKALRRLKLQCERAKCHLSAHFEAKIEIDCLHQGIDFEQTVTRAWFEDLNSDLFEECLDIVDQCLKDANTEKRSVDVIVLVGGSTRIPMVQQLLKKYFNGKELYRDINPDEAVAYGAAIQAAVLNGADSKELKNLALYDVTPLSLGIAIEADLMSIMIPRNTTIPVKIENDTYRTRKDNQTIVSFQVYQGERSKASDNCLLGEFLLQGIPPAPSGTINFKVCFDIDVNGILNVSAQEPSTRKKNGITITNSSNRLSEEKIRKMVEDGKRYKSEDEQHRKKAVERNTLEMYANKMRNLINKENICAKVSYLEGKKINDVIDEAFQWLKENNDAEVHEITAKMKKLRTICKPIDR